MNKQGLYALYNDDGLYEYMQNSNFKNDFSFYYFKLKEINELLYDCKKKNKTLQQLLKGLLKGQFKKYAFIRTFIRFLIANKYNIQTHKTFDLLGIFYWWSAQNFLIDVITYNGGDTYIHVLRYIDRKKYIRFFKKKLLIQKKIKMFAKGTLVFDNNKTLLNRYKEFLKQSNWQWEKRNINQRRILNEKNHNKSKNR